MLGQRSPSLRGNDGPKERPKKVGACFESCAELPALLASAVVGHCGGRSLGFHSVLMAYACVSKAFRAAVLEAIKAWCKKYSALKDQWVHANQNGGQREVYRMLARMTEKLDEAFGPGFYTTYGNMAYACSLYTPLVYMSMLSRRCTLCRREIKRETSTEGSGLTGPCNHVRSYTFAHTSCQAGRCIKMNRDWQAAPIQPKWKSLTNEGMWQAVAARWASPYPPLSMGGLMQMVSPLTKLVNSEALNYDRGMGMFWYQAAPELVRTEDTLLGALKTTQADVDKAKKLAQEERKKLAHERDARIRARKKETAAAVTHREAALRVAMGAPENGLRLTSIEEVREVHATALRITGIADCIDRTQRMACAIPRVIHAIRYLEYIVGDPPASADAIDFFLGDTRNLFVKSLPSMTSKPFNPAIPVLLRSLDAFTANQFEVESALPDSRGRAFIRIKCTTKWCANAETLPHSLSPRGLVSKAYDMSTHNLMLCHARLEAAGAKDLIGVPLVDVDPATRGVPVATLWQEFVTSLIDAALDPKHGKRRMAFSLLGLEYAMEIIMSHLTPAANVPHDHDGAEEWSSAMESGDDGDDWMPDAHQDHVYVASSGDDSDGDDWA